MEAEELTAEQLAKEQDFNTLLHVWFEQIRNAIQNELIEIQKSKIGLTKYKQVKDATPAVKLIVMKKALNAYKQVGAIQSGRRITASFGSNVIKTGLESVRKAKVAVLSIHAIEAENGVVKQVDIMAKIHHINKTFEIVDHLKASLNADASQEISDNLAGLYGISWGSN